MERTEKLYYAQPPVGAFAATVLACEAAAGGWLVTLDRTAFYPEGGGQPADQGRLGGAGVLDVHEKEGVVLHLTSAPLAPGSRVEGTVDLARRWDHTQQHSGEHILSGLLHSMFGAENVGFHIVADYLTMDTSLPIPPEGLLEAERRANQVIWADPPLEAAWYTDKDALAALVYRSKKELDGPVRIVTVPGADCCACCGTHVQRAGQVGQIKIIDWQKYKEGTRLFVVCGGRALAHHEVQRAQCAAIGAALSAKANALADAVLRQQSELEAAKFRAIQAENQWFAALAAAVQPGQAPVLLAEHTGPDGLRRLVGLLTARTGKLCAAFAPAENGLAYALGCAAPGADLRPLCKAMNAALGGRGGGKPGFVQGSVAAGFDAAQAFLSSHPFK